MLINKGLMKQNILNTLGVILILLVFFGIMYGMTYIAKTLSYNVWYEDQVKETVIEMYNNGELK